MGSVKRNPASDRVKVRLRGARNREQRLLAVEKAPSGRLSDLYPSSLQTRNVQQVKQALLDFYSDVLNVEAADLPDVDETRGGVISRQNWLPE